MTIESVLSTFLPTIAVLAGTWWNSSRIHKYKLEINSRMTELMESKNTEAKAKILLAKARAKAKVVQAEALVDLNSRKWRERKKRGIKL